MKKDQLKITISDDEREFLFEILNSELEALNKIEEYKGQFKEEYTLINSLITKIGLNELRN